MRQKSYFHSVVCDKNSKTNYHQILRIS